MFTTNFYRFMSWIESAEFLPLLMRPETLTIFDKEDAKDNIVQAVYYYAMTEVFNQAYVQTQVRPMTELLSRTAERFEHKAQNCITALNEYTQLTWFGYYADAYAGITACKKFGIEPIEYRFLTTDENDVRFLADYIMRISGDEK